MGEDQIEPIRAHFKLRVVLQGCTLYLASWTEPELAFNTDGELEDVYYEPIEHPDYGDTVGFIKWKYVTAISWRFKEEELPKVVKQYSNKFKGDFQ